MKYFTIAYFFAGVFLEEITTLLPPPVGIKIRVNENLDKMKLNINQVDIEDAIDFATRNTEYLEQFETIIQKQSRILPGTPAYGFFMMQKPDWTAIKRGRQAQLALKASEQLTYSTCYQHNIDLNQCIQRIQNISFQDTSLSFICDHLKKKCSPKEKLNNYRSLDGTCNHVNKRSMGESHTAFSRLLSPKYLNYLEIPKRSVTKEAMPSARQVSNAFVKHNENPHEYLTLAFSQWGQFIEEDLSRFASPLMIHYNVSFRCCDDTGFNLAPRYTHPSCMPIYIPSDDIYYTKKRIQCMDYARSLPALRLDCSLGHMEQQNQATHYLDGSQIYGATLEKSLKLREKRNGKLKTSIIGNKTVLPLLKYATKNCLVKSDKHSCFDSGDTRVNFIPQLTVMHMLWVKEHNRITEELTQMNMDWDGEMIFQEARRIVIAEMQHITYNEWMKNLLGQPHLDRVEKQKKFNEKIDPTTSNEFATAAIRALYSMIPKTISLMDDNKKENSTIRLLNHFNKPEIVTTYFESLVRGLTSQKAQKIGVHFSEDITNNLFANANFGYDLLSLDIQRGRDHGLQGYNAYRHLCGLKKATKFNDFADVMLKQSILTLSKIYKHVDDVDLIIGGLLEKPVKSILGPTFSCIIADQFIRTKQGDSFFYTNPYQTKPFTSMQLAEIQKITLARIFCDNSNIRNIQPRIFEKINDNNLLVSCNGEIIPKLNLTPFKIPSVINIK